MSRRVDLERTLKRGFPTIHNARRSTDSLAKSAEVDASKDLAPRQRVLDRLRAPFAAARRCDAASVQRIGNGAQCLRAGLLNFGDDRKHIRCGAIRFDLQRRNAFGTH